MGDIWERQWGQEWWCFILKLAAVFQAILLVRSHTVYILCYLWLVRLFMPVLGKFTSCWCGHFVSCVKFLLEISLLTSALVRHNLNLKYIKWSCEGDGKSRSCPTKVQRPTEFPKPLHLPIHYAPPPLGLPCCHYFRSVGSNKTMSLLSSSVSL